MTTSNQPGPQEWGGRLSPADVHNVLFSRAGLGRRGYDEVEVDVFLERVQQELQQLIAEKADLRDEISRLRSAAASAPATSRAAPAVRGAAAPPADGALSQEEANLQAVRLLAAAQQTADLYVADAEKYSQRLTVDARDHSEAMLEEAREAARTMVREAERLAHEAGTRSAEGEAVAAQGLSKEELDQQVAYLKTFGQVVRVQLRSYLEALLKDVEEEWGRADPAALGGARPAPEAAAAASAAPAVVERDAVQTDTARTDTVQPDAVQTDAVQPDAVPTDAVPTDEQRASGRPRKAARPDTPYPPDPAPFSRDWDDPPDRPRPEPRQADDGTAEERVDAAPNGHGPRPRKKTVTMHSR